MHEKPNESDWKEFRRMVPDLRERYLRKRNGELVSILGDKSRSPTEQFWDVVGLTQEIAKILRTCLDGHSRSKMTYFMGLMYRYGMLTKDDLEDFTEELRERILWV